MQNVMERDDHSKVLPVSAKTLTLHLAGAEVGSRVSSALCYFSWRKITGFRGWCIIVETLN